MTIEIVESSGSTLVCILGLKGLMADTGIKIAKIQAVTGITRATISKAINEQPVRKLTAEAIARVFEANSASKSFVSSLLPETLALQQSALRSSEAYMDVELTAASHHMQKAAGALNEIWHKTRNSSAKLSEQEFNNLEADFSRITGEFRLLEDLQVKM